jgi:hypothetical protein
VRALGENHNDKNCEITSNAQIEDTKYGRPVLNHIKMQRKVAIFHLFNIELEYCAIKMKGF